MTQLKVVIVDDEQPARNRLRELLEDCRGELPHRVAGEAANARRCVRELSPRAR